MFASDLSATHSVLDELFINLEAHLVDPTLQNAFVCCIDRLCFFVKTESIKQSALQVEGAGSHPAGWPDKLMPNSLWCQIVKVVVSFAKQDRARTRRVTQTNQKVAVQSPRLMHAEKVGDCTATFPGIELDVLKPK